MGPSPAFRLRLLIPETVTRSGRGFTVSAVLLSGLIVSSMAIGADLLGPLPPSWITQTPKPVLSIPPAESVDEDLMRKFRGGGIGRAESSVGTIERASGEEKGPRIPEPMVFDLVRPLGATRGEAEFNTLGLIPLVRKTRKVDDVADPLGLVRRSPDRQGIEWAPEFEFVLADGLAVELELPLENASVEAYKAAGQATFGTLWDHRFIHGAQVITQYDRQPRIWTTTWLYVAGFRFDQRWSLFGMIGPRFEHGNPIGGRNTEILSNVTLFADLTDRLVGGIETNVSQVLKGSGSLLVMPQVHYEVDSHWMVQAGIGVRLVEDLALPEVGFRLIREF